MRKVIAVLILIGLGALMFFNPSILRPGKADPNDKLFDEVVEENEILPLAKANRGTLTFSVENLQKTPDEIVRFNAMLMKVMYTGNLTEDEIELLGMVQRQYYTEDLLEMNPVELHLLGLLKEVKKAVDGESRIVDFKVSSPEYSPINADLAFVTVTFIPNSVGESGNIYQRFVMERVKGLWYIKGWVPIDDITITEK
jgi:hypothetical protein